MSLTDTCRNEMQRIFAWAEKNAAAENILATDSASGVDSFFVSCDGKDDWSEYGFNTIPELKEQLTEMWSGSDCMQEVIIPCAVGAFKAKPVAKKSDGQLSSAAKSTDEDIEIKDFVYMI